MSGGASGARLGEGLASSFERRRWHHSTARPGIAQDRSHVPARAVITGHRSLLRKQGERDAAPHAAVERDAPAHKDDGVSTRSLDVLRALGPKESSHKDVSNVLVLDKFDDKDFQLHQHDEFEEFQGLLDGVGRTDTGTQRSREISLETDQYNPYNINFTASKGLNELLNMSLRDTASRSKTTSPDEFEGGNIIFGHSFQRPANPSPPQHATPAAHPSTALASPTEPAHIAAHPPTHSTHAATSPRASPAAVTTALANNATPE